MEEKTLKSLELYTQPTAGGQTCYLAHRRALAATGVVKKLAGLVDLLLSVVRDRKQTSS